MHLSTLPPLTHLGCFVYIFFLLRLWNGMYNRFERSVIQKETAVDMALVLKERINSLEDHLKLLEKVKKIKR